MPYFEGPGLTENVFRKVLEEMIEGFRAAITRKPHCVAKNGKKNTIFWPKTVFLGPEWSDIRPHTLFSGCWTQDSVFSRVLRQMIKGLGATITKKPHFLPKKMPICLPKTAFLGHEWSVVGPHTLF